MGQVCPRSCGGPGCLQPATKMPAQHVTNHVVSLSIVPANQVECCKAHAHMSARIAQGQANWKQLPTVNSGSCIRQCSSASKCQQLQVYTATSCACHMSVTHSKKMCAHLESGVLRGCALLLRVPADGSNPASFSAIRPRAASSMHASAAVAPCWSLQHTRHAQHVDSRHQKQAAEHRALLW
jgi:hypothetical protein